MFSKSSWRSILLSTAALLTLGITSQSAHADIPDENYQTILSHLLTSVVPPKLDAFHTATNGLAETMDDFCSDPDQSELKDAQTAFHEAMDIWQELQPWRMGPMVANGRDQHIEYWPDKHGTAARQFRKLMFDKPAAYTDPEKLAGASAALQGFPALEEVLFDDKHAEQMVAANEDGIFLCQYGTAIAINLGTLSGELQADWPEFAKAMRNAGPESMDYPTAKFAATDLYRALHEGLLIISSQKLARPLNAGRKANCLNARFAISSITLLGCLRFMTANGATSDKKEQAWRP